jgi:hypothetical protein
MYQGQKVHLFRPNLSFPRLENRRGQKALFGRGAQKTSLEKLQIYLFCIYFFQID